MYAVKMLNDDSVLIPDVKMEYNLIVQIRIVKRLDILLHQP